MKAIGLSLIFFGVVLFAATFALENWAEKQFENGAHFEPIVPEYFVTGGQF